MTTISDYIAMRLCGNTVPVIGLDMAASWGCFDLEKQEFLYEALEKIPGIQVYGNSKECRGPVMSLNFKGLTASDAAYILESGYGITVRAGLHCSPLIHEAMGTQKNGTIRISISYFTKEKDIQEFLTAAEQIAGSVAGR